jgi:hypothetical protein
MRAIVPGACAVVLIVAGAGSASADTTEIREALKRAGAVELGVAGNTDPVVVGRQGPGRLEVGTKITPFPLKEVGKTLGLEFADANPKNRTPAEWHTEFQVTGNSNHEAFLFSSLKGGGYALSVKQWKQALRLVDVGKKSLLAIKENKGGAIFDLDSESALLLVENKGTAAIKSSKGRVGLGTNADKFLVSSNEGEILVNGNEKAVIVGSNKGMIEITQNAANVGLVKNQGTFTITKNRGSVGVVKNSKSLRVDANEGTLIVGTQATGSNLTIEGNMGKVFLGPNSDFVSIKKNEGLLCIYFNQGVISVEENVKNKGTVVICEGGNKATKFVIVKKGEGRVIQCSGTTAPTVNGKAGPKECVGDDRRVARSSCFCPQALF